MSTPSAAKKLAEISAYLMGVLLCINLLITMFPELYLKWFMTALDGEVFVAVKFLGLFQDVLHLPLLLIAVWVRKKKKSNGTMTVILTAAAFLVRYLFSLFGSVIGNRFVASCYGAKSLTVYSVMNVLKGYFSIIGTIALILLCCAAAIEWYAETLQKTNTMIPQKEDTI